MIFCFKFLILQHKLAILQKNNEKNAGKGIKVEYLDIIMIRQSNCCDICIVDKTLKMQIIFILICEVYIKYIRLEWNYHINDDV